MCVCVCACVWECLHMLLWECPTCNFARQRQATTGSRLWCVGMRMPQSCTSCRSVYVCVCACVWECLHMLLWECPSCEFARQRQASTSSRLWCECGHAHAAGVRVSLECIAMLVNAYANVLLCTCCCGRGCQTCVVWKHLLAAGFLLQGLYVQLRCSGGTECFGFFWWLG